MNVSKNFRSTTYGRIVHDVSARKYGLRETISKDHCLETFFFLKYLKSICYLHMGVTCKISPVSTGTFYSYTVITSLWTWWCEIWIWVVFWGELSISLFTNVDSLESKLSLQQLLDEFRWCNLQSVKSEIAMSM